MKRKKSKLQKELESKGWELWGNIDPDRYGTIAFGGDICSNDFEIKQAFLSKGFKDVEVTSAYMLNGKAIENMRAVYVKRE